jgi:hypothetical protein
MEPTSRIASDPETSNSSFVPNTVLMKMPQPTVKLGANTNSVDSKTEGMLLGKKGMDQGGSSSGGW